MEKVCRQCDTCGLIHLEYSAQLEWKNRRLEQLLGELIQPQSIATAPQPLGYRLTAKLRVAAKPLRLGIYQPGSSEVVDLAQCPVHHPFINSTITTLKSLLGQYGIAIYDIASGRGFLRGVLLRVDPQSERIGVVLVTTSRKKYHTKAFQSLLGTLANEVKPLYLVQNYNDTSGNRFLGEQDRLHSGKAYHVFRFCEEEYTLPAAAFTQANGSQARLAYEQVLEYVGKGAGRVAELYSGAAITGLALSTAGREVLALEIDPQCVLAAAQTAVRLGLDGFQILEGDVDQHLQALQEFAPEVVIVNPPRKGLTQALLVQLQEMECQSVIYMSCNPVTLRTDIYALSGRFKLTALQPLDMFPQTEHIEAVALLERWG